jgi:hypothetical protein
MSRTRQQPLKKKAHVPHSAHYWYIEFFFKKKESYLHLIKEKHSQDAFQTPIEKDE